MPKGREQQSKEWLLSLIGQASMVFLCTSLIVRPLTSGFTIGLELTMLFQLFTLLAWLMWVCVMVLRRELTVVLPGIGIPLLIYIGAVILSLFRASCLLPALATAFDWTIDVLLFFLVFQLAQSPANRRILVRACLATGVIVSTYGLVQYFKGFPEMKVWIENNTAEAQRALGIFDPINWNDLKSRLHTDEVFSTFVIPNALAGYLLMIVPLLVADFFKGVRSGAETVHKAVLAHAASARGAVTLLSMCVVLGSLFLTGAKGAWICAPLQVLVFVYFLGDRVSAKFRRWAYTGVAALICGGIAVLLMALLTSELAISERILAMGFGLWDSFYVRIGYWLSAIEILKADANLLLGVGANNFQEVYPLFKTVTASEVQKAHNHYLQILTEIGVVGALAFVAFWVLLFRKVSIAPAAEIALPQKSESSSQGVLYIACGLGFLIVMVYADAFRNIPTSKDNIIIGLALVVMWCVYVHFTGRNDENSEDSDAWLKAGCMSGLSGMLLHSVIDFDLYVAGCAQVFWLLAAIALATKTSKRRTFSLSPARQVLLMLPVMAVFMVITTLVFPRITMSAALRESGRSLLDAGIGKKSAEESLKNVELALNELEFAENQNPFDPEIPVEISRGYRHLWMITKSPDAGEACIRALQRATYLAPLRGGYHYQLGLFMETLAMAQPNVVARRYEALFKGIDAFSDCPRAFRPALLEHVRARELYPSKPSVWLPEADLLWRLQLRELARNRYLKIIELDDQIHPRWKNLKLPQETRSIAESRAEWKADSESE